MDWNFNLGWFFTGLIIFLGGGLMVYFYKPISDNLAYGINSYEKMKFWGIIVAVVGLLIMMNLHTVILNWLVSLIFL